jgi:hypothetical protein
MPSAGERYRARRDAMVMIWVGRGEAAVAQLDGVVPVGEIVIVEEGIDGSELVFAQPERYAELEQRLIPLEYRESPYYGGYGIAIDLSSLLADFELISPAA